MRALPHKLFFIIFFSLFLCFPKSAFAKYVDVNELTHQEGVEYVVEKKIMTGFPDGTFRPLQPITRAELASALLKSGVLISLIDSCGVAKAMKDVARKSPHLKAICRVLHRRVMTLDAKGRFRPNGPVTLSDAAKALTKAFSIPVKEIDPAKLQENMPSGPHWFTPYLEALENRAAIPGSFANAYDLVTRAELAEMLYRLLEDDRTRASKSARTLAYGMRFGGSWKGLLRMYGDLTKPFPETLINEVQFQAFLRPASYSIIDGDQASDDVYCYRFAGFETSVEYEEGTALPNSFAVTLIGESSDNCVFPRNDIPEYTCPDQDKPADEQFCNIPKTKPYTLKIIKENGKIRFEGLESAEVLRIDREEMQPLPFEFGTDGPFYENVKVDTKGSLETATLGNNETIFTFKTPWQKIFQDIRGMSYIAVKKKLSNGKIFQRIHYDPIHNRNSYGRTIWSYDECIKSWISPWTDLEMKLCIKQEAGKFVVSSRQELSENMIFWIDPHFKR